MLASEVRLNLGSGSPGPDGWTNVNLLPGPGIDYALDIRDGLPFEDAQVDYVVCHHVLDLFDLHEMMVLLRQIHRVLKPGGVLRISLASQEKAFEAWVRGDLDWFSIIDSDTIDSKYEEFTLQRGARKQYLDSQGLERLADLAGFARHEWEHDANDHPIRELDSRPEESWFAEFVVV